ncbi:MAG TPA: S53 family peptidase [Candidatus Dormibacteraeota bacterium]
MPGSRALGPADPKEVATVTIVLRPRPGADGPPPRDRAHLSREQLAATRGAHPDHLAAVEDFARTHRLAVVESSPARRSVVVSGSVEALSAAFGVELMTYDHPAGRYRGRTGPVHVPSHLAGAVLSVMGLDNRPQAQPHFRAGAVGGAPPAGTFTPDQVAKLYGFPSQGTGTGQTVAVIELGGGYTDADLATYFGELGIAAPQVTALSVDGGANQPVGDPSSADAEVMLDIEVIGAVAPGAGIAVYFAPNTDQGFLDAITTAVHDTVNQPSIISISWGSSESNWTQQALQAFNQAFLDAAHLGVTVCAAAGDNGSADGVGDGLAHADYPSSDPYVLGCGGTTLTSADGDTISSEIVWNHDQGATGGGISDTWDVPDYQAAAGVPPTVNPNGRVGRGVPDVAGNADPATGYLVRVDGQEFPVGGTSAVAPLWAGLLALVNEQLGGPAGFINPLLYTRAAPAGALHDITQGNNDVSGLGGYTATVAWDPCTGLGSPDGAQVLLALSGAPAALAS